MADAGYKLKIEGEEEFNAALRQINDNIRINKSELRALTEQYNLNGGGLDTLTAKGDALRESIGEQQKKLSALREMYAKASETLDEHDGGMVRLKISVNDAEAALAKMTAEYQKNEAAIAEASDAAKDYDSAIAELNAKISANSAELALAEKRCSALVGESGKLKSGVESLGTSEDAMRAKSEALTRAAEDQRKKLDTLREALSDAAKRYGEGSVQASKYREEIAKTEGELDTLNKSLSDNGFDDADTGAKKLLDTLTDIAGQAGIEIPGGLTKILGGLDGATLGAGALAGAVGTVYAKLDEAAAKALELVQNISSSARTADIDTGTYQELKYTAEMVGANVDSVVDALKELTNKMYEAKDGISGEAAVFAELGVRIVDDSGELRNSVDVFYDVLDALGDVDNKTERNAITMKLMGESAQTLNPLIYAGAESLRYYAKEARETGYVVSSEAEAFAERTRRHTAEASLAWEAFWRDFGLGWASFKGLFTGMTTIPETNKYTSDAVDSLWEALKKQFSGYARGTYNAPGGWSVVGESGPELVRLPGGSEVIPSGSFALGGQTNYYNVTVDAKNIHEFNDIVRIAESKRQSARMGWTGGK